MSEKPLTLDYATPSHPEQGPTLVGFKKVSRFLAGFALLALAGDGAVHLGKLGLDKLQGDKPTAGSVSVDNKHPDAKITVGSDGSAQLDIGDAHISVPKSNGDIKIKVDQKPLQPYSGTKLENPTLEYNERPDDSSKGNVYGPGSIS